MKAWLLIIIGLTLWAISSCTYTERITDGKTAYERKQYSVAIPMLKKEYGKSKELNDKAEKAYMLGESYRRTHQSQSAADWYRKAQENRYGKDADLKYARMLQQLEDYEEAKRAYRSAGRYAGDVNLYREQMYACDAAKRWLKQAKKSTYQVVPLPLNDKATDFAPIVYDEHRLLVSSDRQESEGKDNYKWTGQKFFDLYWWDTKMDTMGRFSADFNKEFHQGTLTFSPDKDEVFFTQCGSKDKEVAVEYCKIMYSHRNTSGWSAPVELDLGGKEQNFMHPVVSEDGDLLVFASNDSKGFGGYDLYYAVRIKGESTQWSAPVNMGSSINSKGNEVFPYLDQDTLYFSSDGHRGMGGLDIFKSTKEKLRWQRPTNLKAPINSGGDDFGFVINPYQQKSDTTQHIGYFASNREGGKGSDDIYQFVKHFPPPPDTTQQPDTPQIILAIKLDGLVKEKIFATADDPNSAITDSVPMMGASVQVRSVDTAFTIGSDIDGTFYMKLDFDTDYNFKATKAGYFTQVASISTKGIELDESHPDTTLYVEIIMEKIFKNQEIVLENIYYDLDKSFIREDAKPTLDSLIGILKRNPSIKIQLSSHTDCQGSSNYNQKLSQRRAEAAVQYLIQKEINPERLKAKGYGEERLAVQCKCSECTDEQHQQNRRTTFLVLDEEE